MTTFSVDIHPGFQAGLSAQTIVDNDVAALACKVTEGSGWYRAGYHDFAAAAKRAGLLFCAYHFLRSESSGQAQAGWIRQCMGADWGVVPVMLDWETSVARTRAGVATANAFITEVRRLGGRIELNYMPRWYWTLIGSPSLSAGPVSTLALIQSAYGANTAGAPAAIYPGDHSSRWTGFGGLPVSLLQFGSNARLSGYSGPLDVNAYRGDRTELARTGWFYDPHPEDDMPLTDADVQTILEYPLKTEGFDGMQGKSGDVAAFLKTGHFAEQRTKRLAEQHVATAAKVDALLAAAGEEVQRDAEERAAEAAEHAQVLGLLNAIQVGDPGQLVDLLIERFGEAEANRLADILEAAARQARPGAEPQE